MTRVILNAFASLDVPRCLRIPEDLVESLLALWQHDGSTAVR
jgi:hypothetical protein